MQVTLSVESDNRDHLFEARDLIDELLRRTSADAPEGESADTIQPDIATLWPQLGPNAQRLLSSAAQNFGAGQEFTFADLAPTMGLSVDSVKAIHRNLSRALTARGVKVTDVLVDRWAKGRQHYHLPEPIHTVIRGYALNP